MSSKSDYFENKLTDVLWRWQSLTVGGNTLSWAPAAPTYYIGIYTAAPSDAGGGTECTGGSYARQAMVASLANMSGTQGASSTTASAGTNATTSNNSPVTFTGMPACSAVAFGIFDAISGGNMLEWSPLTGAPIAIAAGATIIFQNGQLTIQEDN
jgi:hypothetical protein